MNELHFAHNFPNQRKAWRFFKSISMKKEDFKSLLAGKIEVWAGLVWHLEKVDDEIAISGYEMSISEFLYAKYIEEEKTKNPSIKTIPAERLKELQDLSRKEKNAGKVKLLKDEQECIIKCYPELAA